MVLKSSYICSKIYENILKSENRFTVKVLELIRAKIIAHRDPIIFIDGHIKMYSNFSHNLHLHQKKFGSYDKQLKKISKYMKATKKDNLNIIDVGANVGDTILNIGDINNNYLLIEGMEQYIKFIEKNLIEYKYILENCFCGEINNEKKYNVSIKNGTGNLIGSPIYEDENTKAVSLKTINQIVETHKFKVDLLKVDTDGFDFSVIRSGFDVIKKYKPAIFFEWDKNFLELQNEDPLGIFENLYEIGYKEMLVYDNFGNTLVKIGLNDLENLKLLIKYPGVSENRIYYYDLLMFNQETEYNLEEFIKNF